MLNFREYVARSFASEKMKKQVQQLTPILIDLFTIPSSPQPPTNDVRSEGRLEAAHERTERYWTDTGSPVYDWLMRYGVRLYRGQVPPFAQGGSGRAYFINDKVVKFTPNRVEANVASLVAGRKDLPTPVLGVLPLDKELYAILQHLVDTKNVPIQIRKAADYLMAMIDDNPQLKGYPSDKSEQDRLCRETIQKYNADPNLLPSMMLMMDVLAQLYQATGFKHDDAGPTNIAMQRGRVVIPDLGPNQGSDYNPAHELAKLRKNRLQLRLPPKKPI